MMNESEAKKRIGNLQSEVKKHNELYHTHDAPEISDEAYDSLVNELVSLEQAFPQYQTESSVSRKVGGYILEGFQKARHIFRQWSFDNVFDFNGLEKWEQKVLNLMEKKRELHTEKISYVAELKIDGLKVILDYEKGKLVRAATRGDGKVGENITENVRMIKNIPQTIPEKMALSVIGEVWIEKKELATINIKRAEENLTPYANPRNLAAGTLRQLDTRIVQSRNLQTFIYDIQSSQKKFTSHVQELEFLEASGFNVNSDRIHTESLLDIQKWYEQWVEKRHNQEYGIDGMVIKINNNRINEALGYTAKAPRFAVAYKFPAEQKTTVVNAVNFQIGRTGILTPVAELEPVLVDGSMVSRASVHNMDEIERLDLRIGDTVIIEKAGDIIPKIKEVIVTLRTGKEQPIDIQEYAKKHNLEIYSDISSAGVTSWYVSDDHPELKIQKLVYAVSKKALNIDGMGERHVRALYDAGYIKNLNDIFSLNFEQISSLPLFKEKSTQNLLAAIQKARTMTLRTLITALGIPHVGEEVAGIYADSFRYEDLRKATYESLLSLHGIGDQIAESTVNFFADTDEQKQLDLLLNQIELIQGNEQKGSQLENLIFVVTGTLPTFSRDKAKAKIKEHGGKVSSAVSSKTDYLLAGEKAGSKLEKAKKLGVSVIDEEGFLEIINKK